MDVKWSHVAILVVGLLAIALISASISPMQIYVPKPAPGGSPSGGGVVLNRTGTIINITSTQAPQVNVTEAPSNATIPYVEVPFLVIAFPSIRQEGGGQVQVVAPPNATPRPGGGGGLGGNMATSYRAISINPLWIIIAALAASTIPLVTIGAMGRRRGGHGPSITGEGPTIFNIPKPQVKPQATTQEAPIKLRPGETISRFSGWGGGKLVSFAIPTDLPLIWGLNEGLKFIKAPGVEVEVEGNAKVDGNEIVANSEGCVKVIAKGADGSTESWSIRIVNYAEDVVNLARLNIFAGNVNTPLTIREALRRMMSEGRVGRVEAARIARYFEDVVYGGRGIGTFDYQEYLRLIGRLRDSVVITCA